MSRPEYYGGVAAEVSPGVYRTDIPANVFCNGESYSYVIVPEKKIDNPIGQPLTVTWQENGKIQYRGCENYEQVLEVYKLNSLKPHVKFVKSVVIAYHELATLANAEKIEREQRELDEKEYQRLKEKLGYDNYATKSRF